MSIITILVRQSQIIQVSIKELRKTLQINSSIIILTLTNHILWIFISQYKLIIKVCLIQKQMDVLIVKQTNKENSNKTLNKQLQRLKVELNDKIFEINKLEEDHAQQKAKQFIDFQKERNNLNRTIKELKEKLHFENQEWEKKIEQFREKSVQDMVSIKQECQEQIKISEQRIKQQFLSQFQHQITSLKNEIALNQVKYTQHLTKIQLQNQLATKSLRQAQEQLMLARDKQYQISQQNMKSQNQKSIKLLQNIYISEKDEKQAVTKQLQGYIQQNVREKLAYEHKIQQLNQKNTMLSDEIAKLRKEIQQLNENIIIEKRMKEESFKQLNIHKIKQLKRVMDDYNKKSEIQAQSYERQIKKLKDQLNQMCKIHQQKQKKWEQQGDILLKSIDANHKKTDNIKTIKSLQFQLMKKENLLQKQRQSLKNCKLQLENMEDIYDKMFVTNNYLYKFRSKSFKVKKMRVPNLLNQSNNSIFVEERFHTEGDK